MGVSGNHGNPPAYAPNVAPSMFFHLAVDRFSQFVVSNLQKLSTKALKKRLYLTKSTTLSLLFHPFVIDISHLEFLRDKVVIPYLFSISSSSYPLIKEDTDLQI